MNKRQKKKVIFGYRMSKTQIRKRIKKVQLLDNPKTIYDGFGISDVFCPFVDATLLNGVETG